MNEDNSPVSPLVKKIQDLEEKITRLENKLAELKCELWNAIDGLDNRTNPCYPNNNFQDLLKRLSNLEDDFSMLNRHKNYQIDENRKVSRRLDEIQESIGALNYSNHWFIKQLFEDVKRIEEMITDKCIACDGEGYLPTNENLSNPDGHSRIPECENCNGTGRTALKILNYLKNNT